MWFVIVTWCDDGGDIVVQMGKACRMAQSVRGCTCRYAANSMRKRSREPPVDAKHLSIAMFCRYRHTLCTVYVEPHAAVCGCGTQQHAALLHVPGGCFVTDAAVVSVHLVMCTGSCVSMEARNAWQVGFHWLGFCMVF